MLKVRNKLLVGSVFVSGERTRTWYNLQIEFLKKTTKSFKHLVFLNGETDQSIFTESEIVDSQDHDAVKILNGNAQSSNHLVGLKCLFDNFMKMGADHYLFLDCDCFPIKKDWMPWLLKRMHNKHKGVAAPVRTENLDVFPHPSALFVRGHCLNADWFNMEIGSLNNLMDTPTSDVGAKIPMKLCYPLLRTNYFNPHPIFAAVYGHAFYHHTCGTRPRGMVTRAMSEGIFEHFVSNHWAIEEMLFNELASNPDRFVSRLMGDYDNFTQVKNDLLMS